MVKNFSLRSEIVWPIRAALDLSRLKIQLGKGSYFVELKYPNTISLSASLPPIPSHSWTQMCIEWKKHFDGSRSEFINWAKSSGGKDKILQEIEGVHSELIDRLYCLSSADRHLIHCVRHFGVRDWISFHVFSGKTLCHEHVGSGLLHLVSSARIDATKTVRKIKNLEFEERTLQRAANLSECGYPTESLLLAFSVLDAAIQKFLMAAMKRKGIEAESADALLRNTTTKRLSTYLDAVLHLAIGVTLKKENHKLFGAVLKINGLRNDAIHAGKGISSKEAKAACLVVSETLSFLDRYTPNSTSGSIKLSFLTPP